MARESTVGRAVIFLDEIDSLCRCRSSGDNDSSRKVITEFLQQMDGITNGDQSNVLVLATTNVPWELDPAIRRRLEMRVHIPLPEKDARIKQVKLNMAKLHLTNKLMESDYDKLGELTIGASGSDVKTLVKRASVQLRRRTIGAMRIQTDNNGLSALDLYGQTVAALLRRAKAPIPMSSGSGVSRGGRLGTAPLRRFIDGVAQRQALSVLCEYGGRPMTKDECIEANVKATQAINTLSNVRSTKTRGVMDTSKQRDALRLLKTQLAGSNRPVAAISTGRENEVVISGVGAAAKCRGVKGTLKPGDRLMVQVTKLDPERGIFL